MSEANYKIILTGHTEKTPTHFIFKEFDKSYLTTINGKEYVMFPVVGPALFELHLDEKYLGNFKTFISNNIHQIGGGRYDRYKIVVGSNIFHNTSHFPLYIFLLSGYAAVLL